MTCFSWNSSLLKGNPWQTLDPLLIFQRWGFTIFGYLSFLYLDLVNIRPPGNGLGLDVALESKKGATVNMVMVMEDREYGLRVVMKK